MATGAGKKECKEVQYLDIHEDDQHKALRATEEERRAKEHFSRCLSRAT